MAKWERLDIYGRDGFRCRYCGFDGGKFETWPYLVIDHIDPLGPRDEESNLATSCQFCNSMKGNDPCGSVEEAKILIAKHFEANRAFWKAKVEPRIIACRRNS